MIHRVPFHWPHGDSRPAEGPGMCDHCGTVERALDPNLSAHLTCPCLCHEGRRRSYKPTTTGVN